MEELHLKEKGINIRSMRIDEVVSAPRLLKVMEIDRDCWVSPNIRVVNVRRTHDETAYEIVKHILKLNANKLNCFQELLKLGWIRVGFWEDTVYMQCKDARRQVVEITDILFKISPNFRWIDVEDATGYKKYSFEEAMEKFG